MRINFGFSLVFLVLVIFCSPSVSQTVFICLFSVFLVLRAVLSWFFIKCFGYQAFQDQAWVPPGPDSECMNYLYCHSNIHATFSPEQ